jgi:hypothetical protein
MPTRLALVAIATILVAACAGGPGPTTLPTVPPAASPTLVPTPDATEPPGATVNPILVSSFCDPFVSEILPIWPPIDAAAAGGLDVSFRAWSENPNLVALSDDIGTVLTFLAVARMSSTAVSPTTAAADAFQRIEAFAAENC